MKVQKNFFNFVEISPMKKWYSFLLAVLIVGQWTYAQELRKRYQNVEIAKIQKQQVNPSNLRIGEWKKHAVPITPIDGTVLKTLACDTIFKVDFQTGIPSTWENLDLDGATDANGRPQDWFLVVDNELTTPGDTNIAVASSSWFTSPGYSNNWLVTDSFTVCDSNLYLVWKSKPYEGPAYMDGYFVLISTTDSLPSSFTDTLEKFAEGDNFGNIVTPGVIHPNFDASNNGLWAQWAYSLKPWYGQRIYIAFNHYSYDDNMIFLDDIMVVKMVGGPMTYVDARVEKVGSTSEYYYIPKKQVPTGIQATATIKNLGNKDTSNVNVYFSVYEGGMPLWNDTVTVASLTAGASVDVTSNKSFSVSNVPGTAYSVIVKVSAPGDTLNGNDQDTAFVVEVTDSTYSRDNNSFPSALSIGAGAEGILGQSFTYPNSDVVLGTLFRINPSTSLGYMYVTLWDVAGGTGQPQNLLTQTDTLTIIDTTTQWYMLPFKSPQSFTGSQTYYVGAYENSSGSLRLSTSPAIFTPQKTWVFYNGSWYNNEDFGFNVVYALRLLSQATATFVENAFGLGQLVLYPNPADDYLFIGLMSPEELSANISLYTLNGQEILSRQVILGNYRAIDIPVSSLAKGLYIVKIQTERGTVIRKVHIE